MSFVIADAGHGPADGLPPKRHGAAALGLACAVLVMVLSLTAFVGGSGEIPLSGTSVGERAADFSLPGPDSKSVRLDQYRGQTVLLIFGPSLPENLPKPRLAANLAVVFVSPGDLGAAESLAERLGRAVVALEDPEGKVALQYNVADLGAAVVVSPEGLVVARGGVVEMLMRLGQDADGPNG